MTADELLTAAAEQMGMHRTILLHMLKQASWGSTRLTAELETTGWFARLEALLIEISADRSVGAFGPAGARSLSDAECLALVGPKLKTAVDAYDGRSALLLGTTGVGKSIAARLMGRKQGRKWARAIFSKERHRLQHEALGGANLSLRWFSAIELALVVTRHPLGKGAPEDVAKAHSTDLIVLDDLTWPKTDDTTLEILQSRYDSGKPTIATAGCTRRELTDRFGDAVVRRLLECRGVKAMLVEV